MRTRTFLSIVVLTGGLAACAETPLLGPGPDMNEDAARVPLGGIGTGSAVVPRRIGGAPAQRAPAASGEPDGDDQLDTDDDLTEDDELPDDSLLDDDEGPLEDDGELLDDDGGLLEDDEGLREPDDDLLE